MHISTGLLLIAYIIVKLIVYNRRKDEKCYLLREKCDGFWAADFKSFRNKKIEGELEKENCDVFWGESTGWLWKRQGKPLLFWIPDKLLPFFFESKRVLGTKK
jgi:hypothetical protein